MENQKMSWRKDESKELSTEKETERYNQENLERERTNVYRVPLDEAGLEV